ncbi:MAG: endonuclease III [Acidobacteriota bacterium]
MSGKKSGFEHIVDTLIRRYDPDWFSRKNRKDPYRILISCLLSLRTKDEVTLPATERLFALARTPDEMMKLKERRIVQIIYPVGFYNVKAKRIIEISKTLVEKYGSRVPDDLETLLTLKGVGRKTANLVISLGYGKPGICVDTHVHRISNRIGIVRTKTPHQTESALRKILPMQYWIPFNNVLVRHGQEICKPISPLCSACLIEKLCRKLGVTTSR